MEEIRLLALTKGLDDKDVIGMILSNYIDFVYDEKSMISIDNFDKVANLISSWLDMKRTKEINGLLRKLEQQQKEE